MKILVIDDEVVIQSLIKKILTRGGFEPVVTANGQEGLTEFKTQLTEIKAAVIDWTLPDISGSDLLVELRAINPTLPCIISSGQTEEEIDIPPALVEPVYFLHKPYRPKDLLDLLESIIP